MLPLMQSRFNNLTTRVQLGSYLIDEPKGLVIFHKTLSEWLSDGSSGHFYTDSMAGKSEIGRFLWNIFIAREINDIGLSISFEAEEHVLAWLPELLFEMPEWKDEAQLGTFASWLWEKCVWNSAEIFLNRVIEINRFKFGNSDPKTIASINHLGDFFREKREFVLATKQYLIALEECQKTLDENHPLTIECLKDYGAALSFSENTVKEAESCLRIALARCLEVFGENHITTFQVMHYLASSISVITEAEDLYKRALAGREKILGINHPETLMTLNNFAGILDEKGDLDGSIDAYRRAYLAKVDVRGKHHPSTLVSLSNLVLTTSEKGQLSEAEAYGREVLEGYEMNFGPDHVLTLDACLGLADVLEENGSHEAEAIYRRILAAYEKINGPEHPLTLDAYYNLALLLTKTECFDEAEALYRRELAGLEKDKGPDHPSTLQTCYELAGILFKKECYDEAEILYRRELAGTEKENGFNHPSTLQTYCHLAEVLLRKQCIDESEDIYRRSLVAFEEINGFNHPSTLDVCSRLARVLVRKSCLSEAIILLRKYLIGTSASEDDICYLRYNLACYECLNGNLSEAKLILTEHFILHPEDFEMALNDSDLIEIKEFIQLAKCSSIAN